MADLLWYFAYGSNMCREIFVERRGMQPSTATWGRLDGYRLCFDLPVGPGERGVANLVAHPAAQTYGSLYRITPEEADRLDRTEGVPGGYYLRLPVVITNAREEQIAAFTYQSSYGTPGRKPSLRYMGLLIAGAREHGLPESYLEVLQSFELAVDERIRTT